MTAPARQLDAIHAMLAAGHRNLRIERHSLLLWGIPAGLLWVLSESILTPAQLPDLRERALAWLGLLAVVLITIAAVDWHFTRKIKATRDEAWSFIHRQVIKIWWLMMGLAALATEKGLWMHVDACMGGVLLPFMEKLGETVAPFDFRVPGVTSMSADLHKYGLAAKGASTIVYRDMSYLRHQFFVATEFPGGIYASPSALGTRPGGTIAAAWAALARWWMARGVQPAAMIGHSAGEYVAAVLMGVFLSLIHI